MLFLCAARLSPSWRWQTAPVQIASTDNPSGNCLCKFQRCSLWQKPFYKSLFQLEVLFQCVLALMVCCVIGLGSSADLGWTLSVTAQEMGPVWRPLGGGSRVGLTALYWHFVFDIPAVLFFLFFFFHFLKFYWSVIDLQCCDNFCHTTKWFSYTYAHIHSSSDSFPI